VADGRALRAVEVFAMSGGVAQTLAPATLHFLSQLGVPLLVLFGTWLPIAKGVLHEVDARIIWRVILFEVHKVSLCWPALLSDAPLV